MKEIVQFLRETGKLKEMPRRGWVINRIENPETIGEHIFRAAIMGWILAREEGLDQEKVIEIALAHDLCEVYAGDVTPYDSILPQKEEELRELMKTWPRFSPEEREENKKKKHENEKESLEKLISPLSDSLKEEIRNLWLDYEEKVSLEGEFFSQADRMENFLQAYEYWEEYKKPPLGPWWIWAREFFDHPLLLSLLEVSEYRFHKRKVPQELKKAYKYFEFFGRVGLLKRKARKGWVIEEIEEVETIAEHSYHLSILVWLLANGRKDIKKERALKIALVHNWAQVYSPETTPLEKRKEEEEEKGIREMVKSLDEDLRREIYTLREEYREEKSPEGKMVSQANKAINFFQAKEYYKKYGKIDIPSWQKRVEKDISDPKVKEFFNQIKEE